MAVAWDKYFCFYPTNQEDWPRVGMIASTLAQHSAIYGNTVGQFSFCVWNDLQGLNVNVLMNAPITHSTNVDKQ